MFLNLFFAPNLTAAYARYSSDSQREESIEGQLRECMAFAESKGLTENALKCKYNGGGLTLGYTIDEEQYFQIDPVISPIINDIFKKYVDGATIKNLVDYLKELGVKNYRGGYLSIDAVKLMLKNRKYIGEYNYRDITTAAGIPAIVTSDLFEKAQQRMAKNKKAPARQKAKQDLYILTTKLFCGKCGAYMVGESGTSRSGTFYQYYKCANVKNHKGCDKKTVRYYKACPCVS